MTADAELLALEVETLWEMKRGRVGRKRDGGPGAHVVVAVATDGSRAVYLGEAVPEPMGDEILCLVHATTGDAPEVEPIGLRTSCEVLARTLGNVTISGGPSYQVPATAHLHPTIPLTLSDARPPADAQLPAAGWQADRWDQLIAGRLGPWAMALADTRVVSLCHCSRLTDSAAEAGVWTDPEYRGRGFAASATAAWAELLAPTNRTLFYSTSSGNRSSQRVAARLALRRFGWIWQIN